MVEMELILQHGWAFDSAIWNALEETALNHSKQTVCTFGERGYFGGVAANPTFDPQSRIKVLVVHSLGLQLTDRRNFECADLLVVISGFSQFHDGTERESRVSKMALRKMLQKLEVLPEEVLKDFWHNCGFDLESVALPSLKENSLNLELLLRDLSLLDQNRFDKEVFTAPEQVLLLHGAEDKIAPIRHIDVLKTQCPKARVSIIDNAEHALPFKSAEWCMNEILASCVVPSK